MTPDVSSVCVLGGGVGTMSPVMTTTCRGEKVVGPSCLGGEGGLEDTLPCGLSHDACDVLTPPQPCEQTDACENITFPQLRLWTVIIFIPKLRL